MSNSYNLITQAGMDHLKNELEELKNIERPNVINDIAEARSHGDLKENSEYVAAKEKQVLIENKINELESMIVTLEVFNPSKVVDKTEIRFGATCELVSEETKEKKVLKIVSSFEADVSKGLIAIDTPVAKSLLGKKVGAEVNLISKGEKREFTIKKISY